MADMSTEIKDAMSKVDIGSLVSDTFKDVAAEVAQELRTQAAKAIRESLDIYVEANKQTLIDALNKEADESSSAGVKLRNKLYVFLLNIASVIIKKVEEHVLQAVNGEVAKEVAGETTTPTDTTPQA